MLRVVEHTARSDTGRQRPSNEDAFFADGTIFAVADGMGGAQAGEVAARAAVDVLKQGADGGSSGDALISLTQEANRRIHDLAHRDAEKAGMGTTLTVAHVGDTKLSIAHVGDSRCYRLRDGSLERLTRDHSLVGELVRQGKLTEEEAGDHPQRSIITRALGPEETVEVDGCEDELQAGDLYLLCSDGLTAMASEQQIVKILCSSDDLKRLAARLVELANREGGADNITVVLFRIGDGDQQVPAPAQVQDTEQIDQIQANLLNEAINLAVADQVVGPPPAPKRRRISWRWGKRIAIALAASASTAAVVTGAWFASQAVYFVGTDNDGLVAVYRGLPLQLPTGLALYKPFYTTGIAAQTVAKPRLDKLLNHRLRSQRDALDLVRKLELGQLAN